jgi:hypothetical protein
MSGQPEDRKDTYEIHELHPEKILPCKKMWIAEGETEE